MATRIAVVEDEPFIAELLTFLLTSRHQIVDSFSNGTDARAFFQQAKLTGENAPDVVVLDLMMPDDDGEEIFDQYLKPGSGWINGRPKVIVLSAVGQEKVKQRLLDAGVDLFMTKPFANDELLAEVDRLCAR